ncbi:hypothetical protein DVB69_16010 [Sporosarcina sp. BI001-red]|uniref:hypothetical protein n=1 Tax=Sporosarcina sp. BI001-red TaxID=2282866 RepID=UPI000E224599|nr:hypothetical protein [Sporosarcina sp. BI001-red]REB05257.1 hypothetical protein DVB69_16010 [Sporosarcina sp. BI001-red]
MQTDKNQLETKLQELRQSTSEHVQELKKTLVNLRAQQTSYISFFTYSLNITHHLQSDNICLASYHIQNTGDYPITNPEITLKLTEDSPFFLYGKYVNPGSPVPPKLKDGWERLNDPTNKKEFRLKPIGNTVIQPGETITFTNFQITWHPAEDYSASVTGWTVSDQTPGGQAALNAINISGALSIESKEEYYE